MAYAAELLFENVLHSEALSGFLFYIENVWMTVGTVQPLRVGHMRKVCWRNIIPGGVQPEWFIE